MFYLRNTFVVALERNQATSNYWEACWKFDSQTPQDVAGGGLLWGQAGHLQSPHLTRGGKRHYFARNRATTATMEVREIRV